MQYMAHCYVYWYLKMATVYWQEQTIKITLKDKRSFDVV